MAKRGRPRTKKITPIPASPATIEQLLDAAQMIDRKNPPEYCGLKSCARKRIGRNLCNAHYQQLWKWAKNNDHKLDRTYTYHDHAGLEKPFKGKNLRSSDLKCVICGERTHARGFCYTHYLDWYRARKRKETNNANL